MEKKVPVLFQDDSQCCGCGACLNACPARAIVMREDEYGFTYPVIDEKLCTGCGRCKRVCAFQNREETNIPKAVYAAAAGNHDIRKKSASGGVFAVLAQRTIEKGGAVCGAAFDGEWNVRHVFITKKDEIERLQGSKYTQSSIDRTYEEAAGFLKAGKEVLYSGTPCQIAGLYGYLGKDYENLLTVDIICHGVPANRMLKEYIRLIEKKRGGKVTHFTFRDKKLGWGINGSALVQKDGTYRRIKLWQSASSYLSYFSKGWIYRKNCYQCRYAGMNRPADLTLGDYWGIEKVHPEYLGKGRFNEAEGLSVVIANTQKGQYALSEIGDAAEMKVSTFENAAKYNAQLNRPSEEGCREELMRLWRDGGWNSVDERFRKKTGWRIYSSYIKSRIPAPVKRIMKKIR